jgi:hypothetical protein
VRVILAIVLLSISVISLGFGIAERTLFADPQTIDREVVTDFTAPATIIHGKDLSAYPGRVTVSVEGGASAGDGSVPEGDGAVSTSGDVFIAYGRTVDVMAWLSPGRHTQLRFDPALDNFYALPRVGAELTLPNPRGSDLWFQEYSQAGELTASLSVPDDVSVVIMTDGVLPAPGKITVSWPLINEALWSWVLIIIGIGSMIAGFVVVAINYLMWRKNRGPRRKLTKRPRPPRNPYRGQPRKSSMKPRGRRAMRFIALPVTGLLLFTASACASGSAPVEEMDPGTTGAPPAAAAPYPAVTELQFSRIMSRIAQQVQAADAELAVNLLNERVTNPSLDARRAVYIIKRADAESGSLVPILASPIRLVLPQQTSTWPRSVMGIIQDEQDTASPSIAVVLRQEDPRSNYQLSYAIVLAPQVQIPDLPSASIGAAKLSKDSKLTKFTPVDVLANYSDVINRGSDSPYSTDFALATDRLFVQLGPDAAALRQESFGDTVDVEWETSPTDNEVVAFATADGGALVMGTLQEVETVTPKQSGASVNASIAVRALTALPQSTLGFDVVSHVQVLWYVPPVGSEEGIRVLGFTYGLIQAKEVDRD